MLCDGTIYLSLLIRQMHAKSIGTLPHAVSFYIYVYCVRISIDIFIFFFFSSVYIFSGLSSAMCSGRLWRFISARISSSSHFVVF